MFVVCGEALFDLFVDEETADGLSLEARLGGSPFNVAVGLARLGRQAALFTGLSRDRLGRRLRRALETESVSTDWLVGKAAPTTLSLVDVGQDGGPSYAFYGDGAADRVLEPRDIPDFGVDVTGVHFGSYSLVADPTGTTLLDLARRAAAEGHLVTLDPNIRLTVEPDVALWRRRVEAFVETTTIVKVSSEDVTMIYGQTSPESLAQRWLGRGARLVVVTRGGEGAVAFGRRGEVRVSASSLEVVDTVGAGDAFQAALIAALDELGAAAPLAVDELAPEDLAVVLDFATAAASLTCGRRGADMPRRAELPPLSEVPA